MNTEKKATPSGYKEWDEILGGGFQAGCFYMLVGRPEMGKTTLALNISRNAIEKGINVLFFSLEMSKEQLTKRLMYTVADKPIAQDVSEMSEDMWDAMAETVRRLGESHFIIDDTLGIEVEEIRSKILKIREHMNPDLIIIDYLHLIVTYKECDNHSQGLEYIIRELKNISRESGIPILALSQADRLCLHDKGCLNLSNWCHKVGIRKAAKEAADSIMFLYRDDFYHPDSKLKGIAEINVASNKCGGTGKVELAWVKEWGRLCSLVKDSV